MATIVKKRSFLSLPTRANQLATINTDLHQMLGPWAGITAPPNSPTYVADTYTVTEGMLVDATCTTWFVEKLSIPSRANDNRGTRFHNPQFAGFQVGERIILQDHLSKYMGRRQTLWGFAGYVKRVLRMEPGYVVFEVESETVYRDDDSQLIYFDKPLSVYIPKALVKLPAQLEDMYFTHFDNLPLTGGQRATRFARVYDSPLRPWEVDEMREGIDEFGNGLWFVFRKEVAELEKALTYQNGKPGYGKGLWY